MSLCRTRVRSTTSRPSARATRQNIKNIGLRPRVLHLRGRRGLSRPRRQRWSCAQPLLAPRILSPKLFDFCGLSLSQFTLYFLLSHSLSSSDVPEDLIIGHISNKNSFENWVLTKYTAPLLPESERDKVRKNWMEDAERMGGP